MDLKLDEVRLVTDFRRLGSCARQELLDYAAFLAKKEGEAATGEEQTPENQCRLNGQPDERPEAAKEPIFTE